MKLQGLAIIFVIIILPITIIIGEYARVQKETFRLEQQYDTRLITATDDALDAFQINTFNDITSDIADSKIRKIEASANAFLNSIESNFKLEGYSKEELQSYVPALVYTMYDGYYIYSPYTNIAEITEETGLEIDLDSDNMNYGLKPYVYYSCRYNISGDTDVIINYSLDNYITVQGTVDGQPTYKSGYLVTIAESKSDDGVWIGSDGKCWYNGVEILKEQQLQDNLIESDGSKKTYSYIKLNGIKYYLNTEEEYIFYLMGGDRIKQVTKANNEEVYEEYKRLIENNTSGISYYKKAHEFTKWINESELKDLTLAHAITDIPEVGDSNNKIFENKNIEYPSSNFNMHRKEVIRYSIETNLSVAIANFNSYTKSGTNFQMPKLKEDEWELLQNEVSIISFLQGLNIGGKIYNGYTVVTNSKTEEVVKEEDIYISTTDGYYHKINEKSLQKGTSNSYSLADINNGFLSLDFEIRQDGATGKMYMQKDQVGSYDSIVAQGNVDNNYDSVYEYLNTDKIDEEVQSIYYTALGRERWGTYKIEKSSTINNILQQMAEPEKEEIEDIVKIMKYTVKAANGGEINIDGWSNSGLVIEARAKTNGDTAMEKVLYCTNSADNKWDEMEVHLLSISKVFMRTRKTFDKEEQYKNILVEIQALDNDGNKSEKKYLYLNNDSKKPNITSLDREGDKITVVAEDEYADGMYSGIKQIEYSFDGINDWKTEIKWDETTEHNKKTITGTWKTENYNNQTLYFRAIDYAGNISDTKSIQITAPVNLQLKFNVDGTSSEKYDGVVVGLIVDGLNKGYVSSFGAEYEHGTNWEIYGLQLDGKSINYTATGTVSEENNIIWINLSTITFNVNNASYGSVSPNSLLVVNDTSYTIEENKIILNDGTGREVIASEKSINDINTSIAFDNWEKANEKLEGTQGILKESQVITAKFSQYYIKTDGIIRNYEVHEEWYDESLGVSDLTSESRPKLKGGAEIEDDYVELDGESKWISLGRMDRPYMHTNQITLEAIIEFKELKSSGEAVIIGDYESGGVGISVFNGKKVAFQVYIQEKGKYIDASYTFAGGLQTKKKYKFTATYDGNEMKLYIDGVCMATTKVAGKIKRPESSMKMIIGANPEKNDWNVGFANINVYSAKVHTVALTAEQVASKNKCIDGLIEELSITRRWFDISGNKDGFMAGGILVQNKYLEFDATDDWINIGQMDRNQTGDNKITNEITMEASIKLDSIQPGEVVVMANYESAGVGISIYDGQIAFQVR